jgi:hypothetical protein
MMNQSKALKSLAEGILQYTKYKNQEIICRKGGAGAGVPL